MKNIIALRSLTYSTTKKKLMDLQMDSKFRDLTEVGSLLNAFALADRDLPSQTATFAADGGGPGVRTILLTGGLLYDATLLAKRLCDKYKKHGSVYQMDGFYYSMTDYQPPAVLTDRELNVPFALYCRSGKNVWKLDSFDGRGRLARRMQYGEKGIPFAVITEPAVLKKEFEDDIAAGSTPTLERMIEDAVEEFAYAAEDFIDIIARELGLDEAPEEDPAELKLAA